MRRSKQPVNDLFVGVCRLVCDELIHLFRSWWKSGQVKAQAPDQDFPGSFKRRCELSFSSRARMNMSIGLRGQAESLTCGQWRLDRLLYDQCCFFELVIGAKSIRPFCAFIDPCANQCNLLCRKRFAQVALPSILARLLSLY